MIRSEKLGRVLHLKLDLPPVNVLNTAACRELADRLGEAAQDSDITALVLSGQGKCFSAGASVEEHGRADVKKMITAFVSACRGLYDMPVPVVALVHGFCFGGALELVLYCDYIVADPTASFAVPEVKLAFFPPLAVSALPGIVGSRNAAHLILTGDAVSAERAREMGLVQEILEQPEWEKITKKFNNSSSPVLRLAKEAFRFGLKSPAETIKSEIISDHFLERLYQLEDVDEGIASFREKRKPQWKNR